MTGLTINLETNKITLELRNKGKTVDSIKSSYYHGLEQELINCLDKLLKRNKIDVHSIKSYRMLGNTGAETTSHKIAEAFIGGLSLFT